jgi:type IV pilus assembly protein PilV
MLKTGPCEQAMASVRRARQRGVGMIEVMVAIVIFAFGMLGLAGLQTAALRYQKSAWLRANTAALATDIAERVRSNLEGAKDATAYQFTSAYADAAATPPAAPSVDAAAIPTRKQIADRDLAEWAAAAAEQLPGGAVNLAGSIGSGYVATLMWHDKDFTDTAPVCTASDNVSGQRHCCPQAVTPGIRCLRTPFMP